MAQDSADRQAKRVMRIGKYEVLSHIATGGMGAVYKAIDTDLHRPVALKVLATEMAARPGMLKRFRREALNAAKLRHENIVAIYEAGEQCGTHFLALEFVEGKDLHDYVNKKGRLDPEEARQILIQAARALEHAHSHQIVHRDIKPSNLMIARVDDRLLVKLTDFGLARKVNDEEFRVTKAGTTVGTVDYMSPEQARNSQAADIRSDIYSLGCTFFHMLAGKCPFPSGTLPERILQHMDSDPPDIRQLNPNIPEDLAIVLRRMLAKKPGERYQTPTELLKDLETRQVPLDPVAKNEQLRSLADLAAEIIPARKQVLESEEDAAEIERNGRDALPRQKRQTSGRRTVRPQSRKKSEKGGRLPVWWPVLASLAALAILGAVLWMAKEGEILGTKAKKTPVDPPSNAESK